MEENSVDCSSFHQGNVESEWRGGHETRKLWLPVVPFEFESVQHHLVEYLTLYVEKDIINQQCKPVPLTQHPSLRRSKGKGLSFPSPHNDGM